MHKAVIVSAARTPIGRFLGGLKDLSAPQLGAVAIRAVLERSGIDAGLIEETYMGHVIQAGVGQNPARQAAIQAGLSVSSGATTVNVVCGSGMKALMLAASAVRCGDATAVIAGGMESMSRAPYLMFGMREGVRAGHQELRDANMHDGLTCAFEHWRMGDAAEMTATELGISRFDQDEFALLSHRRAIAAIDAGRLASEIAPATVTTRGGSAASHRATRRASTTVRLRYW